MVSINARQIFDSFDSPRSLMNTRLVIYHPFVRSIVGGVLGTRNGSHAYPAFWTNFPMLLICALHLDDPAFPYPDPGWALPRVQLARRRHSVGRPSQLCHVGG